MTAAAPLAPAVLGKYAKSRAIAPAGESQGPSKWDLQTIAAKVVADDRIRWCCRNLSFSAFNVEIRVSKDKDRASYHGLQTCGSVWACPVCAAKITEARRNDLVTAVDAWRKAGKGLFLVTFTIPHQHGDKLPVLVQGMQGAQARVYRQRTVTDVMKRMGIVGRVRALEVTHGKNGWHPHVHALFFVDHAPTEDERVHLAVTLSNHWRRAVVAEGLKEPDAVAGVDVRDGSEAAKYASKWGLESEVTKLHTKRGSEEKGETPFDLLRRIAKQGMRSSAVRLFRVYAGTFKGKRQLVWSKGLRSLLGLKPEKADAQIADDPEAETYTAAVLTHAQWWTIYALELRGAFLQWVRERGPLYAFEYLDAAAKAAGMLRPDGRRGPSTPGDPSNLPPSDEIRLRAAKLASPMTENEDLFHVA